VTRVPTGVIPIDDLLDGGIPRGRHVELYGPYSTLKSYVLYKAIAAHQALGLKVALVDTEHSWDAQWGAECGIDVAALEIIRPETAEQAIMTVQSLINAAYDLVGFDSIAAAQPQALAQAAPGSKEEGAPAALARVMSKGLARLTAVNKHTSVIWINQQRSTIGVTFGPQSATSGGKAMGYYASYRVMFRRTGKITETVKKWDGEKWIEAQRVTAHKIQATLEKSKLSAPYTDCHFVFDLNTAKVDETGWLIGQGMERGLISVTATGHYTIPDVLDKAIHGKGAFRTWVDENEEVVEWLSQSILTGA
jgi:recombination protein RecA